MCVLRAGGGPLKDGCDQTAEEAMVVSLVREEKTAVSYSARVKSNDVLSFQGSPLK